MTEHGKGVISPLRRGEMTIESAAGNVFREAGGSWHLLAMTVARGQETQSALPQGPCHSYRTMHKPLLSARMTFGQILLERSHPYRTRRLSGSSSSSSDSQFSPSTSFSCSSPTAPQPARDVHVFERLLKIVPVLPTDHNVVQILIESVSQVMELEQQLEKLEAKTNDYRSQLTQMSVPKDLENVDVTEFKHLVCSQPLKFDPKLFL
ncbi:unnamed protein product [Caenorhabditis auriculariae]|uniref:Uncharacterized protein n=1 Tax=Caenorhabditis auriculariae TaxID=2777116 RepID=A0A8S1HQC2_9PELO|nr:unnamed protein product [Caenorhabditis auriculariae]